jgi:Ca-activated chloride channel family protein
MYKGEETYSKLDGDLLRKTAFATEGGKYLLVRPGTTLDLGQIYDDLIASAERRQLESMTMTAYDERFQIFLALGVALLVGEVFVSERRKTI